MTGASGVAKPRLSGNVRWMYRRLNPRERSDFQARWFVGAFVVVFGIGIVCFCLLTRLGYDAVVGACFAVIGFNVITMAYMQSVLALLRREAEERATGPGQEGQGQLPGGPGS